MGDVEDPIVAFMGKPVGGCVGRDGCAVDGNGERRGEWTEARIDHVGDATDCDGEEHVLAHAFMARFEQDDAGGMSDRGEADRIEQPRA